MRKGVIRAFCAATLLGLTLTAPVSYAAENGDLPIRNESGSETTQPDTVGEGYILSEDADALGEDPETSGNAEGLGEGTQAGDAQGSGIMRSPAMTDAVTSDAGRTEPVALNSDIFTGFSSTAYSFAQYANEKNRGIYTVSNGILWFTSIDDGSSVQILNLRAVMDEEDSNAYIGSSFRQGSVLYILGNAYYTGGASYSVLRYDMDAQETIDMFVLPAEMDFLRAIGADATGRIYVAGDDKIYLLSSAGELLDSAETEHTVYRFTGFDETNDNFYFEGYLNYIYWGYDHRTNSLFSGRVVNNKLVLQERYLDALFQKQWYDHNTAADFLGGKYLVWSAHFMSQKVGVVDSNAFDPTEEENPQLPYLFGIGRSELEADKSDQDEYSWGVRTVYNKKRDSIILYVGNQTISEFTQKDGLGGSGEADEIAQALTFEHVFSLFLIGDEVVAIEQDADRNYTLERILWKDSSYLKIKAEKKTVTAGGNIALSADYDSQFAEAVTWKSSDTSVATVTASGQVYGIKAGKAVIFATLKNGLKDKVTITVKAASGETPVFYAATTGTAGNNVSRANYGTWSWVTNSYLFEDAAGNLNRVEYMNKKVVIEKYSADGKTLKGTKKLAPELPIFGGFFSGADANYLVFGQQNDDESDELEVLRVVKYDKKWNRLGSASVKGANTYIPFDAGNLRMTEYNGKLYIHTCHEMYADSDGTHHQANMSYVVDESTMKVTDSYYEVMNLSTGYVSHSFNQFIVEKDGLIYRVDHAEGNKMYMNGQALSTVGIVLSRFWNENSLTDVSFTIPLETDSSGNYTGISIGGFEVSSENCLIAYNQDIDGTYGNRNVYLAVTDRLFNGTKQVKISSLTASGTRTAETPQLVQINDYVFLVLWTEQDTSSGLREVRYQLVDGAGNLCGAAGTLPAYLSDCQPIVTKAGVVKWYATENSSPVIYSLDPFRLPAEPSKTGWIEFTKGVWMFIKTDGTKTVGWRKVSDVWYFFDSQGIMQTGWKQVSGKWYYFNESGAMQTGWKKISGKWYYLNPSGYMQTKWRKISGKWYYFGTSGIMVTGWQQIDKVWYYFDADGVMKTGWLQLSGKWYFLDSSGAMVTGTRVIGGKEYTFTAAGVCTNP